MASHRATRAQDARSGLSAALRATETPTAPSEAPVGAVGRSQMFWAMLEPVLIARLSPNARSQSHWPRTRARERVMRHIATVAQVQGLQPVAGPVAITFRWIVNTRTKRDIDNLAGNGCVKATLDALVRGGWLVDDSTRYVADVRTVVEYRRGERRLEVVIEEAKP